jgi:hypothetical protein
MESKEFLKKRLATCAFIGSSALASAGNETAQHDINKMVPRGYDVDYSEVRIEKAVSCKPHKGKVTISRTGEIIRR